MVGQHTSISLNPLLEAWLFCCSLAPLCLYHQPFVGTLVDASKRWTVQVDIEYVKEGIILCQTAISKSPLYQNLDAWYGINAL